MIKTDHDISGRKNVHGLYPPPPALLRPLLLPPRPAKSDHKREHSECHTCLISSSCCFQPIIKTLQLEKTETEKERQSQSGRQRQREGKLVNWYFQPSQPQRITSRLKTVFNLSPIYSARKSSNHKLFKNHKISPSKRNQSRQFLLSKSTISAYQNFFFFKSIHSNPIFSGI